MELQVLLTDMARIMDIPPHSSFACEGRDVSESPPQPAPPHPQGGPPSQAALQAPHQPPHPPQHPQAHAQSMLALLGSAAAAAAAADAGPPAGPGKTLALWPSASLPSAGGHQLSPTSVSSDAGDVLAGAADDSASDLFWTQELRFFSAASTPRATPPHEQAANAAAAAPELKQLFSKAVSAMSRKRKAWEQGEEPAAKTAVTACPSSPTTPQMQPDVHHILDGKLASAQRRIDEAERKAKKDAAGGGNGWPAVDSLDTDLDGSLSGLGVDLSAGTYNMGETLLALPSLTVFKQEAPSPSTVDGIQQNPNHISTQNGGDIRDANRGGGGGGGGGNGGGVAGGGGMASQLHQLLQQHAAAAAAAAAAVTRGGSGAPQGPIFHQSAAPMQNATLDSPQGVNSGECFNQHVPNNNSPSSNGSCNSGTNLEPNVDCRFQYVLAAATSIATKINEETLTYLNQGQSYEIKLKKLGELSAYRGKILKSTIRVCFHERRLQYTEREQMAAWQASRPGDRVVEVDVPLSYGLLDIIQDPMQLNAVEFLWDPTKEVGVYIKVNCISTEFTPKKHGGEKGVPFRIQVETYLQGDGNLKRLHAAACQVKVFKLKGADRKHKQDREKILKRPLQEQEKFQPSYECTVLNDIPSDALMLPQPVTPVVTSNISPTVYSPTDANNAPGRPNAPLATAAGGLLSPKEERAPLLALPPIPNGGSLPPTGLTGSPPCVPQSTPLISLGDPLPREATAAQAAHWLEAQRFAAHIRTFGSFSGADLLRLTREDLVQLCGLADGIRLHNALHAKTIAPRLTLYLCVEEQSPVYRALYLHGLSCAEFVEKLAQLVGITVSQLSDVLLQGPAGIHVLLTDDVIRNFRNETTFTLEVLPDTNSDQYKILLKPTQR